ncbi:adenylate kinase isoenzyme 1 [Ptiloglossa arizonensis]|uniref:adenylate kinase isoenzyme 1 n=1 Tax=Ptiloglossa arizonensis TaxID=3350558 RepID=UPI003FA0AD62
MKIRKIHINISHISFYFLSLTYCDTLYIKYYTIKLDIQKTIDSMGNCIKPYDPYDSISRNSLTIDTTPIKESVQPIIFLIGGPGAGKRTLSNKVAEKYGFLEIISSEIIRQEVAKRTERAFMLAHMMSEGHLVPTCILLELITMKILNHLDQKNGVIVSGFPREKNQCQMFDKNVRPPDLVLFLKVRNSVLSDRIMARCIMTMERPVISFETIKKQIKEFHRSNRQLIKYYKRLIVVIDGDREAITVYENTCKVIDNLLSNFPKTGTYETSPSMTEQ